MLVPTTGGDALELAVDLRRADDPDATAGAVAAAFRAHRNGSAGCGHRTLEEWTPTSRSLVWRFNALYWQHLRAWEEATGRGYESALPGGRSGAREDEPVRAMIRRSSPCGTPSRSAARLPEELYVVELGVGNGSQARTWLDAFRELDAAARPPLLPAPALPDGRLLPPRARAGPRGRGRPRRSTSARSCSTPCGR